MAEKGTAELWRSLAGKVVMVTGASSGLGHELCLDLAKAGCRLIAAARRIGRLEELCRQINNLSQGNPAVSAVAIELDVAAGGEAIEAAVQKAWDTFGRIDALINNAGVRGTVKSAIDTSEEEWNNTIKTNLTGSWLVSKAVAGRMRNAKRPGCIINISSTSGLGRGHLPGATAYIASKSAIHAMTKTMALELGAHKIRVNAIAPGLFKSEITDALMAKGWLKKVNKKTIPLGDVGTIDPAHTSLVRYLIDDSSQYVTGNIFIVDAGATLPGTTSDSRIIKNALTREDNLIIPQGLLAPFRWASYHLKEYSSYSPINREEWFNLLHALLHIAIERAFGNLKKRFPVIGSVNEKTYPFDTQYDIVLACCILHNYLMKFDHDDELISEVDREVKCQHNSKKEGMESYLRSGREEDARLGIE